jgi:Methyltransferase domain
MTILSPHVYDFIIPCLSEQSGNYLEIGVFNGEGLANVAKAHPKKLCEAIDPFIEDGYTSASSNISAGNKITEQYLSTTNLIKDLENVNLNVMTSQEYHHNLTDEKIKKLNIDTVVIDGNHHYEHVTVDYKLAMALIDNKKGLIFFDDIKVSGVQQAFNEFCEIFEDRIEKKKPIHDVAMVVYIKEKL